MIGKITKTANVLTTVAAFTGMIATEYMMIVGYRFRMSDRVIDVIFNVED